MSKFKVFIAIFLVFVSGASAGVLGSKLYFKHRFEQAIKTGPPPLMHHLLMRKMVHDLNLSESQRTEIEKILRQTEKQIIIFREKYRPQFEKIIDDSIIEIKEMLNKNQREKLDQIHNQLRSRGRMEHWGRSCPRMGMVEEEMLSTIKKELNLTEDQEKRLSQFRDENLKKKHALYRDYREQEQRNFSNLQKDLEALDQEMESQILSILTEEQTKKYYQIKKQRNREITP
jgi:hypothetical protein